VSKVTDANEYRRKVRKIIELPSGAVFEIRKLSPLRMAEVIDIGDGVDQVKIANSIRDNLVTLMRVVIPSCVVRPKIVLYDTDKKGELSFDDLEPDDLYALLDQVYEHSGLGPDEIEEREDFPEEQDAE